MIDLRDTSILSLLPSSISTDEDIVAMSEALDPEIREVSAAIVEAVILSRIDELPDDVLNEIAWAMRFDQLQVWDNATLDGKRALIRGVLAWRKRSGTPYAVRRIFDLLLVSGEIVEWFTEGGAPYTYRMRITVTQDPGITLAQLLQIPEWILRFGRAGALLSELAVEADSVAELDLRPLLTIGRHVELPFGP